MGPLAARGIAEGDWTSVWQAVMLSERGRETQILMLGLGSVRYRNGTRGAAAYRCFLVETV